MTTKTTIIINSNNKFTIMNNKIFINYNLMLKYNLMSSQLEEESCNYSNSCILTVISNNSSNSITRRYRHRITFVVGITVMLLSTNKKWLVLIIINFFSSKNIIINSNIEKLFISYHNFVIIKTLILMTVQEVVEIHSNKLSHKRKILTPN